MALTVHLFRCLADNFGFLVQDEASGQVAAIDTPDADAYAAQLDRLGWSLHLILNTHWHADHTGGNAALQARYRCPIAGPAEVRRVAPIDRELVGGNDVALGASRFVVIDTPGHTLGHIGFHDATAGIAFVGDTLFTLGCGRMFEGTPAQFAASLATLAALPAATLLYGAHDYTAANLAFALSVDNGAELAARAPVLRAKLAAGAPTVRSTVAEERATNPFLRAADLPIGAGASDRAEAFRRVRVAKDGFRG